jgi:hypothetical protein
MKRLRPETVTQWEIEYDEQIRHDRLLVQHVLRRQHCFKIPMWLQRTVIFTATVILIFAVVWMALAL